MYDHGVNNAQGLKWAAVWYRQSGNKTLLPYTSRMMASQLEFHGQPHGMFAADECFGGRECAAVEAEGRAACFAHHHHHASCNP